MGFQTAQSRSTERKTGVSISAKALIFLRQPRPNHVWGTQILLNTVNRGSPTGGHRTWDARLTTNLQLTQIKIMWSRPSIPFTPLWLGASPPRLSAWRTVLLEKLRVPKLLKTRNAFYRT